MAIRTFGLLIVAVALTLAARAVEGVSRPNQANTSSSFTALVQAAVDGRATIDQVIGAIAGDCDCAPPAAVRSVDARPPSVDVGVATGAPGEQVTFAVSLDAAGATVAGAQNDLTFDSLNTPVAATPDGTPDCAVNPSINKDMTAFAFEPPGCTGATCATIRAIVFGFNLDPIPDGSVLYTCHVDIAFNAADAVYPLSIANVILATPDGNQVPGVTGSDGAVVVSGQPSSIVIPVSHAKLQANTEGAPPNGLVRVRTVIDTRIFGDWPAVLSDGLTVAVSGAGLAVPETMTFSGGNCFQLATSIECVGSRGEVVTFRQQRRSSRFNVTITAQQRGFQAPLSTADISIDIALGGLSLHGQVGHCGVRGNRKAVALCPM